MKKVTFLAILLIAFCAPIDAVRLTSQANNLNNGVRALAKSHNRLWKLASSLQMQVQQLEKELKTQHPGTVSLVKQSK